MNELYSFLFCLALGMTARALYLGASALAKRTDLIPVTVALDILTVLAVGGGFTLYIILTGAVLAPYMFAALATGYWFLFLLTSKKRNKNKSAKIKK